GGVDEVDAELDRTPEHADRGVVVLRRTPDALAGDAHRAEAETVHGQLAAEGERAAVLDGGGHGSFLPRESHGRHTGLTGWVAWTSSRSSCSARWRSATSGSCGSGSPTSSGR